VHLLLHAAFNTDRLMMTTMHIPAERNRLSCSAVMQTQAGAAQWGMPGMSRQVAATQHVPDRLLLLLLLLCAGLQ
jgi:hypothetical protein